MNEKIIVKYSDYESYIKQYQKVLSNYSAWISNYIQLLDEVSGTAITSGNLHNEIKQFRIEFARIEGIPAVISDRVTQIINDYLDDLDEAQKINGESILYDRDYKGYRDYSADFFAELEKCSESADYDSDVFRRIGDFAEDAYYGIAKFFGAYDNSKEKNIRQTQEALLQYNDVTRRRVREIKRRVVEADEKCHERIEVVDECIINMICYIEELSRAMVDYQSSPESMSLAKYDFASKYASIITAYNKVLAISNITNEDVENFINSEASDEFLDEEVKVVKDYLADLSKIEVSDFEFWEMLLFQMFDVAEGTITSEDYASLMMKKELTEMMDELAQNYVYSETDEHKAAEEIRNLYENAKNAGQTVYEYLNSHRDSTGKLLLDGRTTFGKNFKKFLGGLGNGLDILKYGDQGIEIFSKLFIEYDRNLCFLDSFERNARLSDEMKSCFAELRATYEHELEQTLADIKIVALEDAVDLLYSVSIGKTIGIVKTSIGIVGELTGSAAETGAKLDLLNYGYDFVWASEEAYKESLRKLKAADKNSDEYQTLVDDFLNCFSIYKGSLKRLFEKMAIASTGEQKDYYYYCSSEVSRATLKDFSTLDIMTFDEYINYGN